jgi:hypothetical protein
MSFKKYSWSFEKYSMSIEKYSASLAQTSNGVGRELPTPLLFYRLNDFFFIVWSIT